MFQGLFKSSLLQLASLPSSQMTAGRVNVAYICCVSQQYLTTPISRYPQHFSRNQKCGKRKKERNVKLHKFLCGCDQFPERVIKHLFAAFQCLQLALNFCQQQALHQPSLRLGLPRSSRSVTRRGRRNECYIIARGSQLVRPYLYWNASGVQVV